MSRATVLPMSSRSNRVPEGKNSPSVRAVSPTVMVTGEMAVNVPEQPRRLGGPLPVQQGPQLTVYVHVTASKLKDVVNRPCSQRCSWAVTA